MAESLSLVKKSIDLDFYKVLAKMYIICIVVILVSMFCRHNSASNASNKNTRSTRQLTKSWNLPSLMNANVRTIKNKLDELQILMNNEQTDLLCVSETWLSETWQFCIFRRLYIDSKGETAPYGRSSNLHKE